MDRRIQRFNANHPEYLIRYEGGGSGRGLRLLARGQAAFAASDVPLSAAGLPWVRPDFVERPISAGALVVAFNVPGVRSLEISRQVLVEIFAGKILWWDDWRIRVLNPNVALSHWPVIPVSRAAPSGSTLTFSSFLSSVSEEWRSGPGSGSLLDWPCGIGALGNGGMKQTLIDTQGAVGYLDYGRVRGEDENLGLAIIENASGTFVSPSAGSIQAGVAAAEIAGDEIVWRESNNPRA